MESAKEILAGVVVGLTVLALLMAFAKASDPCHDSNIVEECASTSDATECVRERRKVCR